MPRDLEQEARDNQQRYKNVFGTPEGKLVMADILFTQGHLGDNIDPTDPVAMANMQFAVTLARTAGVFDVLYRYLGMGKD
jgi:hypothetical protein